MSDTAMEDYSGSSSQPDQQSSTIQTPNIQVPGNIIRLCPPQSRTETYLDYTDLLNALQIRQDQQERFFSGVLRVIRNKHIADLKRASPASIKNLSYVLLRGYGKIIWGPHSEFSTKLSGSPGRLSYTDKKANDHFYPLLEPIWRRMRDLIFELKPARSSVGSVRGDQSSVGDEDEANLADIDTEADERPLATQQWDRAFQETRLHNEHEHTTEATWSADETDKAIFDLIAQLAYIRTHSDEDAFGRSWAHHIARVEEFEDGPESVTQLSRGDHNSSYQGTNNLPGATLVHRSNRATFLNDNTDRMPADNTSLTLNDNTDPTLNDDANPSNTPWDTHGPPLPNTLPSSFVPHIPETMSLYITTHPPDSTYLHRAYHWPGAPIRMSDAATFFEKLRMKVNLADGSIRGYVFSYGWNEVCRWVGLGSEHAGWERVQRDLEAASRIGVGVWRAKVLVVGH